MLRIWIAGLMVAGDDRHHKHNSDKFGFNHVEANSKIETDDVLKSCNSRSAPVSRSQALSQNYKHIRSREFHRRSILSGSKIKQSSDCDPTARC
jgi:hypothetical protein